MSLSSTYLSVKTLLANNISTKGVDASASDGLTTLANKVFLIDREQKKHYNTDLNNSIDVFSEISLSDIPNISTAISDGSTGSPTYETYIFANNQSTILRTVNGWSKHELLNVTNYISSIDLSKPFVFETDYYIQDGGEQAGLYIKNNDDFYQIHMSNDGGYFQGWDDVTYQICVGKNEFIATNLWDLEDSSVIDIHNVHRMKIVYLGSDALLFEFYGKTFDFDDEEVYTYVLKTTEFVPTEIGLVMGYLGNRDRGGYRIAFNNINVRQLPNDDEEEVEAPSSEVIR